MCGALRSLDCLEHGVDSEVTSGLTLSEIRQIGVDLDVGNGHLSSGCPIEDPADMLITLVTHDSGGSDHRAHVSPGIGDLLEAILIGAMVIACIDDEIDLCSALGRLGLAIDGLEGQVTLVLVRAAPNGDQLFELGIGEAAIVLYTVAGPTDDGQITVHGGGGSALTRFDNDLGNDGGLVVVDKADINLLLNRVAIDGFEGQVTLVLIRAAPNGDQLFELGIGEAAIVLYTVAGPTDDGQITVHGGGGSALTRFDNDLGNDGGLVVVDKADINLLLNRVAIDGIEGQIALLVVIVPAVFLGYQRSQRVEVIRSAIQGTIYRIEFPSGDGLITVLDRRNRTLSGGNCLRGSNWGLIIRAAEADLNRIPLIRRLFGGGGNCYSNLLSNTGLCGIGIRTFSVYLKFINRGTVDRYTGDFIAVSRLKNHSLGSFILFDILIPVLYSAAVINGANYRVGSCAALQSFGQPNFDDYVYACTADCFKSQIAMRNRYVERCIPNRSS